MKRFRSDFLMDGALFLRNCGFASTLRTTSTKCREFSMNPYSPDSSAGYKGANSPAALSVSSSSHEDPGHMHFRHSNKPPSDISSIVYAELRTGECVTWIGQPIPSRFARRSIGIVLFGIPWTAFALFWMAGASGFKMPDFSHGFGIFPLFGLPFILMGFGMLSSPYWMRRKARRTAYVITDQRAIILAGGAFGSITIRSFEPDRLKDIRRVQKPDGTGDLIFERTWASDGDGGKQSTDHGFLAISDVRNIEGMITRLTHAG